MGEEYTALGQMCIDCKKETMSCRIDCKVTTSCRIDRTGWARETLNNLKNRNSTKTWRQEAHSWGMTLKQEQQKHKKQNQIQRPS